jgi:hypothetical protein
MLRQSAKARITIGWIGIGGWPGINGDRSIEKPGTHLTIISPMADAILKPILRSWLMAEGVLDLKPAYT